MFYTYVLISQSGKRTYTGHTSDIEKRLKEHNQGVVISSRQWLPYKILRLEKFESLAEAKHREMYYKSRAGRLKLKYFVSQWKSSDNMTP